MSDRAVGADGGVTELIDRPRFAWGAVTHVGGVREHNEDAFFVSDDVCVVADGMGGHEAGEVASQLVTHLVSDVFGSRRLDVTELPHFVSALNAAVLRKGAENNTRGMGTTLVGVAVADNGDSPSAVVFHVGDSRCYRVRNGIMTQITTDHSHVQDLVADGRITPAEALTHPLRNVITRALGADVAVEADYHVLPEDDCRLLLCSDGLSGELDDDRIWELLAAHQDPSAAAVALVEQVLAGPARDNVTVIVLDVRFPEVDPTDDLRRSELGLLADDSAAFTADVEVTADADITAERPVSADPTEALMVDVPWAPPAVADRRPGDTGRPTGRSDGAAWAAPDPPSSDSNP